MSRYLLFFTGGNWEDMKYYIPMYENKHEIEEFAQDVEYCTKTIASPIADDSQFHININNTHSEDEADSMICQYPEYFKKLSGHFNWKTGFPIFHRVTAHNHLLFEFEKSASLWEEYYNGVENMPPAKEFAKLTFKGTIF